MMQNEYLHRTANFLSATLLVPILLFSSLVLGQGETPEGNAEEMNAIIAVLARTQPNMEVQSIEPSPIDGMYVVAIQNMQTIYATADARFFIPGDLFETLPDSSGLLNHGEEHRNEQRLDQLSLVPESEMIIYEAVGERKATLSVFTDLDCPYCRRLHAEVETLNEMGIAVRYLAFPRQGLEGETYDKMVSTWCSENPEAYMTSAKRGGDVPSVDCVNPVARHYQLGQALGVKGTPALVLESGYMVNGYVPAETLRSYLLGDG